MIRTEKRMRLCAALLTANLLFIWGNSLLPGEVSGAFSQFVRDLLAQLIPGATDNPQEGHGLVRKLAHFTEFCTLGAAFCWLFGMLLSKPFRFAGAALVASAAVAAMDETIQLFVPGRGPGIKDVGIDTLGAVLGIALMLLGVWIRTRKQSIWRNSNNEKMDSCADGADTDCNCGSLQQP